MLFMMMILDPAKEAWAVGAVGETAQPSQADLNADATYAPWSTAIADRVRGGSRLRPPSEAVTVRVRDGELLRSDGPFAETKEVIGGYDIIEAADMEEAIRLATLHPSAADGAIEIRPIFT